MKPEKSCDFYKDQADALVVDALKIAKSVNLNRRQTYSIHEFVTR